VNIERLEMSEELLVVTLADKEFVIFTREEANNSIILTS
jgi:hypothetical protein